MEVFLHQAGSGPHSTVSACLGRGHCKDWPFNGTGWAGAMLLPSIHITAVIRGHGHLFVA